MLSRMKRSSWAFKQLIKVHKLHPRDAHYASVKIAYPILSVDTDVYAYLKDECISWAKHFGGVSC